VQGNYTCSQCCEHVVTGLSTEEIYFDEDKNLICDEPDPGVRD